MAGDPTLLLAATASAFVALLMLRAALDKAADGVRFEGVLADYDLVPDAALRPLRIAVPVLELLAAGALSFGVTRMAGAGLAGVLLLSYACAMGLNLTRGRSEIDCGCGGPAQPLHWALVARNLCLTATLTPAALGLAWPLSLAQAVAAWAAAIAAFTGWLAFEQLLANAARMSRDSRAMASGAFGGGR